jgi:hypothetical protein
MYYYSSALALAAFIPSVYSHAVILEAVGDNGQSQGFLGRPSDLKTHEHNH